MILKFNYFVNIVQYVLFACFIECSLDRVSYSSYYNIVLRAKPLKVLNYIAMIYCSWVQWSYTQVLFHIDVKYTITRQQDITTCLYLKYLQTCFRREKDRETCQEKFQICRKRWKWSHYYYFVHPSCISCSQNIQLCSDCSSIQICLIEAAIVFLDITQLDICVVQLRFGLDVCVVQLPFGLDICIVKLSFGIDVCAVQLSLELDVCVVQLSLRLYVCVVYL